MNDSPQINDLPDIDSLWNYEKPAETEKVFRELLEEVANSDEEYRAELLTQIARCQGLQGNFTDAHSTLDQVQEILTPDMPTVTVRYLPEGGRVFNSAGEAEKAGSLFRKAWETAKEYGPDHLAVDAAHMIGIVEKGESSLAWNEKALSLARSSTDPRAEKWIGSLFNNIGWTRHEMGEYEKALELFQG
ncbi:MAG TPA: tetratricopeptide repeat protein, partial [Phycisphaeraceae bacterium]|nr:tetratricopeptide repeat protein [Phycisphaeraceae bacterium]